jgi:6-phosphogluconolactonase
MNERAAPALREEVHATPEAAARAAAAHLARALRAAVRERGRCSLALSGGRTAAAMLRALAAENVPWSQLDLFQVDEREAPPRDADRNWTGLEAELLRRVPLAPGRAHPVPAGAGLAPEEAARRYAVDLEARAGRPPALDALHLGLGADGHTASLFPGDPALDVRDAWAAATCAHGGRRRVTLTFPALDAARCVVWLVVGAEKRDALARLRAGDTAIPAGRVARARALLVCDAAASGPSPSGRASHDGAD